MTTVCATPHTSVYMGAMPNPAFVYIPAMATPKTQQNYTVNFGYCKVPISKDISVSANLTTATSLSGRRLISSCLDMLKIFVYFELLCGDLDRLYNFLTNKNSPQFKNEGNTLTISPALQAAYNEKTILHV